MTVPLLKQRADIEVCENAMKKRLPEGSLYFFYLKSISSTSKTSGVKGGIISPAPRSP